MPVLTTNAKPYFDVVAQSGLWTGSRRESHGFLLSPDVYAVAPEQLATLNRLNAALWPCMTGLGDLFAEAYQRGSDQQWSPLLRNAQRGIPKSFHPIQLLRPEHGSAICKVDLMEDASGNFRIAEIDGMNERGMGYSTLTRLLRGVSAPDAASLPGCAATLAAAVQAQGSTSLILLYPAVERFYRPEFEILQAALAALGIDFLLVCEGDRDGLAAAMARQEKPLFLHYGNYERDAAMAQQMRQGYESGSYAFLIPPKPWMSSKAVLAIVRNDDKDPWLETMLRWFIPGESLETLREFIPETRFVSSDSVFCRQFDAQGPENYVLKTCYASGMKGTVFADQERFAVAFAEARRGNGNFVIQQVVENKPVTYRYFDATQEVQEAIWFQRVVTHFAPGGVADITVTARQDKSVHGAPDCIQIGAILS